jgi:subtilase family serine protease
VRSRLSEADSAYKAMKYADALQSVLAAHQLALQIETAGPVIILVVGVVIGVVLGLVIAVLIMKRRESIRK